MSLPPIADVGAESALLGLVIQGLPVLEAGNLRPEDFSEPKHGQIWAAAQAVAAQGQAVELTALASALQVRGHLAEVGGPAYLMHLDSTPGLASNAGVYSAAIQDKASRRALVALARRFAEAARDELQPVSRVALEAAQAFGDVRAGGGLQRGGKLVLALSERWERYAKGETNPYLPLPFDALDETFKGFVNNLNVVGGRSGIGKTAFVAECMWHWLVDLKLPGGVFGLEDGADWLIERATARRIGIPYGAVGACRLHEHQQTDLQNWLGRMHEVLEERLFIHESPAIDFADLLAEARRWVREGARWIVIDHGLRIRYQAPGSRERLDLTIGNAMNALADFGIRAGVPVVLCWHLNRDSEEESPPKRSDFKESGYLDAAARTMLGLWKHAKKPGRVLATVVKSTKGQEGHTYALERDAEHGLIHAKGGELWDIEAEKRAERETQEQQRQDRKRRAPLFNENARTA